MLNEKEDISQKIQLESCTTLFLKSLNLDINDPKIFDIFLKELKIVKIGKNNIVYIYSNLSDASIKYLETVYDQTFSKALTETLGKAYNYKIINDLKMIDLLENTTTQKQIIKTAISLKKNKSSFLNEKFTFNNYVKSNFNEKIIQVGKHIINSVDSINDDYNLIFIYASTGLGKTHFLHALGNELSKKNKIVKYVNPDIYSRDIAYFLKENDQTKLKLIRDNFCSADVVMFDDFQSYGIGNKKATVHSIFNILDYRMNNNLLTIICADQNLAKLNNIFDSRIISRLSQALQLEIEQPDNNDWLKILDFILKENGISPEKWENEAKLFLTRNYSTSIRALLGAVTTVKFHGDFVNKTNSKYTVAILNSIFKDIIQNKENITPTSIIEHVAKYYKLTKKDLLGNSRKQEIVLARDIAIFIIRTHLDLTFQNIGKIFGNRDHSTIINSIKKIEKETINSNKPINKILSILSNEIYKIK